MNLFLEERRHIVMGVLHESLAVVVALAGADHPDGARAPGARIAELRQRPAVGQRPPPVTPYAQQGKRGPGQARIQFAPALA